MSNVQKITSRQYLELLLKGVDPVEFFDKPIVVTDGNLPVRVPGVYNTNEAHYAQKDAVERNKKRAEEQEELEEQLIDAKRFFEEETVKLVTKEGKLVAEEGSDSEEQPKESEETSGAENLFENLIDFSLDKLSAFLLGDVYTKEGAEDSQHAEYDECAFFNPQGCKFCDCGREEEPREEEYDDEFYEYYSEYDEENEDEDLIPVQISLETPFVSSYYVDYVKAENVQPYFDSVLSRAESAAADVNNANTDVDTENTDENTENKESTLSTGNTGTHKTYNVHDLHNANSARSAKTTKEQTPTEEKAPSEDLLDGIFSLFESLGVSSARAEKDKFEEDERNANEAEYLETLRQAKAKAKEQSSHPKPKMKTKNGTPVEFEDDVIDFFKMFF